VRGSRPGEGAVDTDLSRGLDVTLDEVLRVTQATESVFNPSQRATAGPTGTARELQTDRAVNPADDLPGVRYRPRRPLSGPPVPPLEGFAHRCINGALADVHRPAGPLLTRRRRTE
jgi:hypothetical protein